MLKVYSYQDLIVDDEKYIWKRFNKITMARKAKIITLQELKEKVESELIKNDMLDPYEYPSRIENDLKKVEFDHENVSYSTGDGYCGYPCGYEVLENGLPVLFVNAGGDWENPVCYCIYWDGKNLRAYIPEDGNEYNKSTGKAWGNGEFDWDDESEEAAMEQKMSEGTDGDPELIRKDVMNRIQII